MVFCIIKARLGFFFLIFSNNNLNYAFKFILIVYFIGIGYSNISNNIDQL